MIRQENFELGSHRRVMNKTNWETQVVFMTTNKIGIFRDKNLRGKKDPEGTVLGEVQEDTDPKVLCVVFRKRDYEEELKETSGIDSESFLSY